MKKSLTEQATDAVVRHQVARMETWIACAQMEMRQGKTLAEAIDGMFSSARQTSAAKAASASES